MIPWALAAFASDAPLGLTSTEQADFEEAEQREQAGDLVRAAELYRGLLDAEPNLHQLALDLGRVLHEQGRDARAVELYRTLPYDPDVCEALGRLLVSTRRSGEAVEVFVRLRELRPDWPGTRVLEAEARAQDDPDGAALLLEEYLGFEGVDPQVDDVERVTKLVCGSLAAAGHHQAGELLTDVLGRFPELEGLRPLLAQLEVDQEARALARANDVPLAAPQAEALRAAREAFAAGRADEASGLLEGLVAEQPSSAVTWATLADVREARGDLAGAEQAAAAAERLDPLSAAYPAKLGQILASAYGGRYDQEAANAYARAVLRRADDPELWWAKAEVERSAGQAARANASFARVLALDPQGPHAAEAQAEVAGYLRARPAEAVLPPAAERPADVPEAAWWAYHRAQAWMKRPDPDPARALTELAVVREQAPNFVPGLDLQAAIRVEKGDLRGAVATYEDSLALEPDQPRVVWTLATLYDQLGRSAEAQAARDRAAELGDPDALWRRAQVETAALRWTRARRTLADFFVHTTGGPAYDQALALDQDLLRKLRFVRIAGVGLAFGVLVTPLLVVARRRSGSTLEVLLSRSPQVWRDVARICAAIRHEVLKHHVSALPVAAAALEDGDPEPVRWVMERLVGAEGAVDRLWAYVAELEAIGRAEGVRLNLRVRDPVFAPMLRAVRRLQRVGARVQDGRADRRLATELQAVSAALNDQAYRGLGEILGRLAILQVDLALLVEVYEAVRDEPGFRGEPFPALALEVGDEALHVRMFRADLASVLANLVRNAARATLDTGGDAIGLAVAVEEDPVTALESVAIQVRDQAPGRLSTATLRGRFVERGLGLAMDLTSRAGGSMHVQDQPGWAKAVVVRLPRAEV